MRRLAGRWLLTLVHHGEIAVRADVAHGGGVVEAEAKLASDAGKGSVAELDGGVCGLLVMQAE